MRIEAFQSRLFRPVPALLVASSLGLFLSRGGPGADGRVQASGDQVAIANPAGRQFDVRAYGATGNGTTDDTLAVQSAVSAADAHGGVVFFPPGTYKIRSAIRSDNIGTSFVGAGKYASSIDNEGSGDGIYQINRHFSIERAGAFEHLQVRCQTADGTTGIHIAQELGALIYDVRIAGCGKGLELENPSSTVWTEETQTIQYVSTNNTYGLYLTGKGPASSFGYSRLEFYCEMNEGQTSGACLRVDNGAWLYNSRVELRVNLPAEPGRLGPDIIQVDRYGKIENDDIVVYGEGAEGQPVIAEGPSSLVGARGPVSLRQSVYGAISYLAHSYPGRAESKAYGTGHVVASTCPGHDFMMVERAGTTSGGRAHWNCGMLDLITTDGTLAWRDVGSWISANGGIYSAIASSYSDPLIIRATEPSRQGAGYLGMQFTANAPGLNETILDQDGYGGFGFAVGRNVSHAIAWGYMNDPDAFEVFAKRFDTPLSPPDRVAAISSSGSLYLRGSDHIGGVHGPSWSSGSGPPSGQCTNGSLYSNVSGSSGSTFYVCVSESWTDVK